MADRIKDFLGTLAQLPPDVNRYDATIEALLAITSPLNPPGRIVANLVAIGILYVMFTIVIFQAIDILVIRRPKSFSAFVSVDRGLILPNAVNWLSLWSMIFALLGIVEMTIEITLPTDAAGINGVLYLPFSVVRYVPAYIGGIGYFASIAGSYLVVRQAETDMKRSRFLESTSSAAPARRHFPSWRICAWLLNISWLFLTIACPAAIVATSIVCSTKAARFRKGLVATLSQLEALAPTYSPATYSPLQLYQALIPVELVQSQGAEMLNYFRYGWLLWVALTALLSGLFLPIAMLHMRLLVKVNRERGRLAKNSSALRDHHRAEASGAGSGMAHPDQEGAPTGSAEGRLRKVKSMARWRVGALATLNQYEALIMQSAMAFLVSISFTALGIWVFVDATNYRSIVTCAVTARYAGQMLFCFAYSLAAALTRKHYISASSTRTRHDQTEVTRTSGALSPRVRRWLPRFLGSSTPPSNPAEGGLPQTRPGGALRTSTSARSPVITSPSAAGPREFGLAFPASPTTTTPDEEKAVGGLGDEEKALSG